jgi:hypothetical protein
MAVKIVLKRSSVLGKRPSSSVVEAGELALNTNSVEPGIFFEVTDGSVIKVGPTSVLPTYPTSTPELGEMWYNTIKGTLNTGTVENTQKTWAAIAAPYLGGSGYTVFVAPEFPGANDSIQNDGQALPFQTVARAIIELSKATVNAILAGYPAESENNRYTIYLAPSRVIANNSPGVTADNFTVDFSNNPLADVTDAQLTQFNSVDGGIILPRGISIVGMDLKKCEVRPTHIPTYLNHNFPVADAGTDQTITSIFKWAGNTYLNNFSVTDKVAARNVNSVAPTSSTNNVAVFSSARPHGLNLGDSVTVNFAATVDQTTGTFTAGVYYVSPLNVYTFSLSSTPLTPGSVANYVLFSSLPVFTSNDNIKFTVTNNLYSAHRLRVVANATVNELADYYTKIQKAFPAYFGGKVTSGAFLVSEGESIIVGPTQDPYPNNLKSNTVANSSAYANQVNLRSQYGMCFGDFDGDLVAGFRSVVLNACTAVSLQNDPVAYEIYTTLADPATGVTTQKWWPLTEATYLSYPLAQRPSSIVATPVADQMALLNSTAIPNIRYYYRNLISDEGKSYGIVNINRDFRHFGFRAQNSAYMQAQSVYTIGTAVGVWALNGGLVSLTNSTTNFGSVAFKSEGFYGINSIGGASANNSGFQFSGVQAPLSLSRAQVEDIRNKEILSLGARVISVTLDPNDSAIQLVKLSSDFTPCYLLPYSLKPGSAVWVATESCTYRGFFATDGGPTVVTGQNDPNTFATLRLRAYDSTIPSDALLIPELGLPFIRRFRDPRTAQERSYSLVLRNTLPTAVAPSVGQVLRLNQSGQTIGNSTLKPNVQFDPGALGGWGRVFTVNDVQAAVQGSSPQFNYVISDTVQDSSYYVTVTTTDYDRPWTQFSDNAQGTYTTTQNKNWYAAENNLWDSVYYDTIFTPTVGPEKLSPVELCAPYVATSPLERQDLVADTYQGAYAADAFAVDYPTQTYFRGATNPYTEYGAQSTFDEDDSSESLGICIKTTDGPVSTFLVEAINPSSVIQTAQQPDQTLNRRYRPEVIEFSVLSPIDLVNPKQAVSVVSLSNNSVTGKEYLRIIGLNGNIVTAIRLNSENSLYPNPPAASQVWPSGTLVTACVTNINPTVRAYDPNWSSTKRAVLRFFEVMGYPQTAVEPLLAPRYWGERFIPVNFLPISPATDGYAAVTGEWPLQFNTPSTILANTHTWAYCGYYNYSRGLPDYQTNNFSRKLNYDYLSTTLWSGALTVTGITESGDLVQLGNQREALTSQFYEQPTPTVQLVNQEIYETPAISEFPAQVVVYSTDDISALFDGVQTTFNLTTGGVLIPSGQLSTVSTLVSLGAVTQTPSVAYSIVDSQIVFVDAPQAKTVCDVRIITSEDAERTLVAYTFNLSPDFDGVNSIFTVSTAGTISAATAINEKNLFVFLGGVEQIPVEAYYVTRIDASTLEIYFTEAPDPGTTVDIRCFTTGEYWVDQAIYPVEVYSLDDIAPLFNGAQKTFPLTAGGAPLNPAVVSTENLFISIGGAIQLPTTSYTVTGNLITFVEAPATGTTSNLRILTNAEFLTCPRANGGGDVLRWGPGLILTLANSLIGMDSGSFG